MAEEEIRGIRPEREVTAEVPAPKRRGQWKLPEAEEIASRGVPESKLVAGGCFCPQCGQQLYTHSTTHFLCERHGFVEQQSARRR